VLFYIPCTYLFYLNKQKATVWERGKPRYQWVFVGKTESVLFLKRTVWKPFFFWEKYFFFETKNFVFTLKRELIVFFKDFFLFFLKFCFFSDIFFFQTPFFGIFLEKSNSHLRREKICFSQKKIPKKRCPKKKNVAKKQKFKK